MDKSLKWGVLGQTGATSSIKRIPGFCLSGKKNLIKIFDKMCGDSIVSTFVDDEEAVSLLDYSLLIFLAKQMNCSNLCYVTPL